MTSSLSFEEFKKSIVRIASICTVITSKQRIDPSELLNDQDRLLSNSGGEAPAEWDELGNPIKYRTIVSLKKRNASSKPVPTVGKLHAGKSGSKIVVEDVQ